MSRSTFDRLILSDPRGAVTVAPSPGPRPRARGPVPVAPSLWPRPRGPVPVAPCLSPRPRACRHALLAFPSGSVNFNCFPVGVCTLYLLSRRGLYAPLERAAQLVRLSWVCFPTSPLSSQLVVRMVEHDGGFYVCAGLPFVI